jgi:cysteine desulfurase
MKKRIYLDAAAAHPVRKKALQEFVRAQKSFGNPSAPHEEGRVAAGVLEDARTRIARLTGAKPDAVIFTSGATESNALAIVGHIRARLEHDASYPARVLYSPTQHASVIGAVETIRALGGKAESIPLVDGAIDFVGLRKLLLEETTLITLDVVCGETGTRFDTRGVRKIIDTLPAGKRPVFHVDATQAPLVENMERTRLGADLISFDAQKIGGVRGIGALIAPRTIPLAALVLGGGQERGLRSGTPSPALALSFASALEDAAHERDAFVKRAGEMKPWLKDQILAQIPRSVAHEAPEEAPHILNVSLVGRDTDYLVALLDEAGYAVATRSACETDAAGSRVVLAYTGDAARAASTLRVSFSAQTKKADLVAFMKALTRSVAFLDAQY